MSQPTSIVEDAWGGRCACTTNNQTLNVDPQQNYTIYHTGTAAAGTADTADIFFGDGTTAIAAWTVGKNRLGLKSGTSRVFRFTTGQCNYVVASGVPVFEITPQVDGALLNF